MRLLSLALSLLMVVNVFALAVNDDDKEVKLKTSAKCEMCKERIEHDLAFTKGIKGAVLNLDDKVVTVKYNPKKTNVEKIKASVAKIGYDADEVVADQKAHDKLPKCCQKSTPEHSDAKH
ncbi:heavy-metal-associated domain-containing protein [Tellurirhabdus bombi]|uniref:heavy-metal-associated domain-containing protein n=1 Tax=Tellurirhabdus bombi TaxID=2907205 RepID=UPI00286DC5D2|nr:heavy metal-associated domain-containing protein [Tellurirhabdus bombi]